MSNGSIAIGRALTIGAAAEASGAMTYSPPLEFSLNGLVSDITWVIHSDA